MATRARDASLSFIDDFQSEIDRLGCMAVVRPAGRGMPADTIELFDEDGGFISLLPSTVTPETAVLAFGLYQLGMRTGRRLGEDDAWSRLRQMIGVSSPADPRRSILRT